MKIILVTILSCLAATPQDADGLWTKIICGRPARAERAANVQP